MADRKRILAVDDDVPALNALRQMLAQRGYDVDVAANGEDALQMIARQPYDLFLLDVNMPDVSGFDLCKTIRQKPATRDTPVIFLTAKGMVSDILEGQQAGSDLYLVKPVLSAKILNMIGMFLSAEAPLAKKPRAAGF